MKKLDHNNKFTFLLKAGLLLLGAILTFYFSYYFIIGIGTIDIPIPNDPLVGRKFSFGHPLVYEELGSVTTVEDKIHRDISCLGRVDPFNGKEKSETVRYIPSTMEFTVERVYRILGTGLLRLDSGDSNYRLAILRDKNGVVSTLDADAVESRMSPCSTPEYLAKLYSYIETFGKAHIEVALYKYEKYSGKIGISNEEVQMEFIESLTEKYNVSEITKVDQSFVPGTVGVKMTVDADTFAYLVMQSPNLPVYSITGLDPAYLEILTPEDKEEIHVRNPFVLFKN